MVAAAVRSTWSPCGLSMLSTITPFGERGRGHAYRATATWFVVGAAGGGATLGLLMAGLAAGRLRPAPVGDGHRHPGPRRRAGGGGIRLWCRRRPPALPPPPGQRAVARPLPALGLRRRLRLADRLRPGHLHHQRRRLPDDRARSPDRTAPDGPGRGCGLRRAPRDGRAAHPAADRSVRPARLPPPVLRARPGRRSPGGDGRTGLGRPDRPLSPHALGSGRGRNRWVGNSRRVRPGRSPRDAPRQRPARGRAPGRRPRRDWSPPAGLALPADVVGPARSSDPHRSSDRTVSVLVGDGDRRHRRGHRGREHRAAGVLRVA